MPTTDNNVKPEVPQGRRRRRLLPVVDLRFQLKYAGLVAAVGVICSSVCGLLLLESHRENTSLLSLGASSVVIEEAQRGDQIFMLYLVLGITLTGILLFGVGILITHRMAGPLFLTRRYLTMLAQGTHPDMRPIRARDEYRTFYQTVCRACDALAARDRKYLRELEDVLATIPDGENGEDESDIAQTRKRLEALRDQLRSMFEQ
ncbi:MAG: hypothetical protein VX834_02695 [Myxococcota bacterium]|nr:hypothetical protein [Myxococcota bacterium]